MLSPVPEYMNTQRPKNFGTKPGGEPRDCRARLVTMTGDETFVNCRAVRFTPTHTMIRLSHPETTYLWLPNSDCELGPMD